MELVQGPDGAKDLAFTLWMMPVIYIILTLLRFGFTMALRPLYIAIKGDMSFRECIFVCAAGLRGSASLIMGSAVVTYQMHSTSNTFNVSQCNIPWASCWVFCVALYSCVRGGAVNNGQRGRDVPDARHQQHLQRESDKL
jgi:NhaP-type Na+/H+ and K+/H+ antiporter